MSYKLNIYHLNKDKLLVGIKQQSPYISKQGWTIVVFW